MISAATQGVGKTIIPVPAGNQLSACTHADHPPSGPPALTSALKVFLPGKTERGKYQNRASTQEVF